MIKAREQNTNIEKKEYAPLPEGTYNVEIVEVEPEWKEKIKSIEYINAKDNKGNLLKDDNGNLIKDPVNNYSFHTLDMKFRVLDGEHKGRYIFGSLTTHDNVLFLTEGFLYAVGIDALNNKNDIFDYDLIGKTLKIETTNQNYNKEITNKDTGLTETIEKVRTRVKKFIKNSIIKNS